MKHRFAAVLLLMAVASFAQTTTQTQPSAKPAEAAASAPAEKKAGCPCCQKMAEGKPTDSCCMHHHDAKDGEAMSCCGGKDGMSCMKNDKDKSSNAACGGDKCCGGEKCCGGDKGCAMAKNDGDKAMACCGGGQCGMKHDHQHGDMKE